MTIGSAPDCSITLPGLARLHARLERPRAGTSLTVSPGDAAVYVDGSRIHGPTDLREGGVLRLGDTVLLHRRWTEDEARDARLPPLPGPVDSCHPVVVSGLRNLQARRHDGGTFWVVGEEGGGRSVAIDHLRALLEEASGRDWITGGPDLVACHEAPDDADPNRTLVIPPLRERGEDMLVLVRALRGGTLPAMSVDLVEGLVLYDWPGNIRELRLAIARALDGRWGVGEHGRWELTTFPDVKRHLDERTGRQDPITIQTPERPLPRTEPEMRRLLDAHWWRIYPLAAATGRTRSSVLRHIFALGIRDPWPRH